MFISEFPKFSQVIQVMPTFLSVPPTGRTLPLTRTRLSDLDGGVFDLGASVASISMNVLRPIVKAGLAHIDGETWDDLLEYYIVRVPP